MGVVRHVMAHYDAVLFDLLTALIDSWSLWDRVAGGRDAGRRWRAAYLELTYGCGPYRPYEELVREAALATGLTVHAAERLASGWESLAPWDDAAKTLRRVRRSARIGVVSNCSERLGRQAAALLGVPLDVVVTAERAGFYKPDPAPYRLALAELKLPPARVLFVAGSGFDLIGTHAVGLPVVWHNRAGIAAPPSAPAPMLERRTLGELFPGPE
ncbi:MAG TPA: HAD-IA family hydrolase [Burkholderiales bacterium]|nr:HAD-IA family hydrolase [Burkholderiales bacterium]